MSIFLHTFGFAEGVFARLFVTLASPKVLSLEKTQIKFGFLLAYLYLCSTESTAAVCRWPF